MWITWKFPARELLAFYSSSSLCFVYIHTSDMTCKSCEESRQYTNQYTNTQPSKTYGEKRHDTKDNLKHELINQQGQYLGHQSEKRHNTKHSLKGSLTPLCKKATIHQVTTMIAISKNVLNPGHNHLLITGTDDLTLWLLPKHQWSGNRIFLDVASMVVTWWIVAFCTVLNPQSGRPGLQVSSICIGCSNNNTAANSRLPTWRFNWEG